MRHLNHWQCSKSSGSLNARWYLMRMTYDATLSQADDMTKFSVIHLDDLARSDISSGWFRVSAVCRVDDIRRRPKSPGWLVRLTSWRYFIRITYDQCSMSSGWLKMLPHVIDWDDLAPGGISSWWLMDSAVCHRMAYNATKSYRDDNEIWTLCHPVDLALGGISPGWLMALCSISSRWHTMQP